MKIENIKSNGKQLAYIIRNASRITGQHFFGNTEDFLQVGIMGLDKDTELKAHYHLPQNKMITKNQEVLIIVSGKMEVFFFEGDNNKKVGSSILKDGDVLVLLEGGHAFKILSDTKLIEVKQGPYEGQEKDKKFIEYNL